MKQNLSDNDRSKLNALIAEMEKRTGAQIVLSVIQRSDSYVELPWKAFALGASIAGFLVILLNLPIYSWVPKLTELIVVACTLAGGAFFALLTVLIPGFAKRFLSAHRADVEVQQYAESLFLNRELFATRSRTGILLLISLFEQKVVILPDRGLNQQLNRESMQSMIASMSPFLKRRDVFRALEAGVNHLAQVVGTSSRGNAENELPDEIIEEKGV